MVYKVSACVYLLFILGAGFSKSLGSLLVCRFLAGAIGGPVLAVGAGTNADMYPARDRAIASSLFIMMPVSNMPTFKSSTLIFSSVPWPVTRPCNWRVCRTVQRMALDSMVHNIRCSRRLGTSHVYVRDVQEDHTCKTREALKDCSSAKCTPERCCLSEDVTDHNSGSTAEHASYRANRVLIQPLHRIYVFGSLRVLCSIPLHIPDGLRLQYLAVRADIPCHWPGCNPSGLHEYIRRPIVLQKTSPKGAQKWRDCCATRVQTTVRTAGLLRRSDRVGTKTMRFDSSLY